MLTGKITDQNNELTSHMRTSELPSNISTLQTNALNTSNNTLCRKLVENEYYDINRANKLTNRLSRVL